jgi:hypothetical protein
VTAAARVLVVEDNANMRLGNRVYTAGGQGAAPILASAEAYDPDADRWEALPPMPAPRHHHAMAAVGGRVYVFGGYGDPSQDAPTATVFVYDPASCAWRTRAPMPAPRAAFGVAVVGGRLFAVGGFGPAAGLGAVTALELR